MDFDSLKHRSELDDDTFRTIMETFGQDVWNYVYFLTGRTSGCDDLVQEVFLKCYRSIDSFRGQSSFKTWLFAIARHTSINARKSAYWRRIVPSGWLNDDRRSDVGASRSAEDDAIGRMTAGTIWQTLQELPDKYREVLVLDAVYGLKLSEIAALLGLSVGGVKSRLFRARSRMSDKLKEVDFDDSLHSEKC